MLAFSSTAPVQQSHKRTCRSVGTGVKICLRMAADPKGRPVWLSPRGHLSAHRPFHDVWSFVVPVRSTLPEGSDGHKNQALVEPLEVLVSESQGVHVAGLERLNHDVRIFCQSVENELAIGGSKIQSNPSLAGIHGKPKEALFDMGFIMVERPDIARHVATRAFYLDHVCTHIPE